MATDRQVRAYWREELILIALLFMFFIGILVFAWRLPFDARLFPMVTGGAGLFLCIIIAIGEYHRWRSPGAASEAISDNDPAINIDWRRYALALLAAPVFGLLLWLFGFFVAALAAMLLLPSLMGYRDWRVILAVALATVVGLALIFPYLLGVNLPNGLVGDWMIDRLRAH